MNMYIIISKHWKNIYSGKTHVFLDQDSGYTTGEVVATRGITDLIGIGWLTHWHLGDVTIIWSIISKLNIQLQWNCSQVNATESQ